MQENGTVVVAGSAVVATLAAEKMVPKVAVVVGVVTLVVVIGKVDVATDVGSISSALVVQKTSETDLQVSSISKKNQDSSIVFNTHSQACTLDQMQVFKYSLVISSNHLKYDSSDIQTDDLSNASYIFSFNMI